MKGLQSRSATASLIRCQAPPPAVHHKASRLNFLVQKQRCHASPQQFITKSHALTFLCSRDAMHPPASHPRSLTKCIDQSILLGCKQERELCATSRIPPAHYLALKDMMLRDSAHHGMISRQEVCACFHCYFMLIVTKTGERHSVIPQQETYVCWACFRFHVMLLLQRQGNATA